MKKSLFLVLSSFILMAFVFVWSASAEETVSSSPAVSPTKVPTKVPAAVPARNSGPEDVLKRQAKELERQIKNVQKTKAAELELEKKRMEENFELKKKELEQRREEFKQKMETDREQLKQEIEKKREELKNRLEKVKDQRKKDVVEKIDNSMDRLNEKMADHFSELITKIEKVLERVGERADRAEERGADVSSVRTATNEAILAIKAARTAIEVQAGKTYKMNITDEATLKLKVGEARQALHKDISIVREAVKSAHEAVRKAAVALAQIPKPSVSPSHSVSPLPSESVSPSPTATQ